MRDIDLDCYKIREKLDSIELMLQSQNKENKEGVKGSYICSAIDLIDRALFNVGMAHWFIHEFLELEEKGDK